MTSASLREMLVEQFTAAARLWNGKRRSYLASTAVVHFELYRTICVLDSITANRLFVALCAALCEDNPPYGWCLPTASHDAA